MISTSSKFVPMVFGVGASKRVGLKARELKITKALLVFDKGVQAAGVIDPIVENLHAAHIETVLFDGVLPDPPDYTVDECGKLARESKVDGIIAIGGGSSMDTAKGANVLINNPPPINQWFQVEPPGDPVPLICIPTTAGTGSEATQGAVITDTKQHKKGGVFCRHCYSDASIVDPELYVGVPVKASVACAFDAFTHSLDCICTFAPEPIAQALAEKAIRLLYKNTPKLIENSKDINVRSDLALAASLAGYAINGAMCHLTHSVGHTLGSVYHLPHGLGCAICMPQIVRKYAQWMPDRLRLFSECIGMNLPEDISNEELGNKVADELLAFMKKCELPTLKELGYSLEDCQKAAQLMPGDVAQALLPVQVSVAEYTQMITEAYDL